MKLFALLALVVAVPVCAKTTAPGTITVPGTTAAIVMEKLAQDCVTLGRQVDAQNETDLSCSSVLTANSQIMCKAAFFAWPNCPDTARDIRRYAVATTPDGVKITFLYLIAKKPGDEKPIAGAGKGGPEAELRAIFPEAR